MSKFIRQEKSQRKHPIISSSTSIIKAPVVPAAPKERPGWKGPGFTKKAPKPPPRHASGATSARPTPSVQQNLLPVELQQLLLNIFRTTFPVCQDYDSLKPTLQEIKNALSGRDFERAFGRLDWMEAYTVRWSPSRALCYAAVLVEMFQEFAEEAWIRQLLDREGRSMEPPSQTSGKVRCPSRAVCYGVGAADLMAFGAALRNITIKQSIPESESASIISELELHTPMLDVELVSAADWARVISSLQSGLTTEPTLSKYASATARANNASFLPTGVLQASCQQCNILEANQEEIGTTIGKEVTLITLFFTISDLLALSVPKCTAFLLKLTLAAPKDSLLLIIDSLDSSAEVTLEKDDQGKERKRYPMHYLLDMVLLEKQLPSSADKIPSWEMLFDDQSRLFRVAEQLKYPISLESIPFQVYLLKKV
ncbi:hypothetical protein N431DRAFT_437558 [Stipitochalara longipes BDJ]|nr:hypothetical protein N431DRAFT_437558 [Stipitochalara longipes BDJ]